MSCVHSNTESLHMTAAAADIALRICYSARVLWDTAEVGEVQKYCKQLADWDSLTRDDGIQHPVQLLLALAVADNLPDDIFGPLPMAQLLNEVCARRAENELGRMGSMVGRRRVGAFLGVSYFSAPQPDPRLDLQKQTEAVIESASSDYTIDPEAWDFKSWAKGALMPWANALLFVRRLRNALDSRSGGWHQLSHDMEAGPQAYADVVQLTQQPPAKKDMPAGLLGVRHEDAQRTVATMVAQAYLHAMPESRRTKDRGGILDEPLGDVREEQTLRGLAVELRMLYYYDVLAKIMKENEELQRSLGGLEHVHSLSKQDFWRLWKVSFGVTRRRFLSKANQGFVNRYG